MFVSGNFCIASDIRGDWRFLLAGGAGGVAGGTATVVVGPFWSNGYVDELAGQTGYFGGSVAFVGAGGVEVWVMRGFDGRPVQVTFPAAGVGFDVGIGPIPPGEIHAGGGGTLAIDPAALIDALVEAIRLVPPL